LLKKTGLGILFFFIAVILSVIFIYRYTFLLEKAAGYIVAEITSRKVLIHLDHISGSIFSGIFSDSLSVDIPGAKVRVTARKLNADYSLLEIISGNLNFSKVELEGVTVTIFTRDTSGVAEEFDSLAATSYPEMPYLNFDSIRINGWKVVLPGNYLIKGKELSGRLHSDSLFADLNINIEDLDLPGIIDDSNHIEFSVKGDSGIYKVKKLKIEKPNSMVIAAGPISFPYNEAVIFNFSLNAESRDLSEWVNNSSSPWLDKAEVKAEGRFNGTYKDFSLKLFPEYRNRTLITRSTARLEVQYSNYSWYFNHFIINSNMGSLEGSAELSYPEKLYLYAGFNDITFDSTIIEDGPLVLNGVVNTILRDISPESLSGMGNLILNNIRFNRFKTDEISLLFTAEKGVINLLDQSKVLLSKNSLIELKGELKHWRGVDFTAFAYNNDFSDYSKLLTGQPVGGHFTGYFNISGDLFDPSVYADFQVDSIITPYFNFYGTQINTNIDNLVRRRSGTMKLTSYKGEFFGFPIKKIDISSNVSEGKISMDDFYLESDSSEFAGRGEVDFVASNGRISLFSGRFRNYRFINRGDINFYWEGKKINFMPFRLEDNLGAELTVSSFTYPQGESSSEIIAENIHLDKLHQIFNLPIKMTGKISANIHGGLVNGDAVYQAGITGKKVIIAENDLGDISLVLNYEKGMLRVSDFSAKGGKVHFDSKGSWNLSEEASLQAEWNNYNLVNLNKFISDFPPIGGVSFGRIKISGDPFLPVIEADLGIRKFQYEKNRIDLIEGNFLYKDTLLTVDPLLIVLEKDTIRSRIEWPMHLDLRDYRNSTLDSNFAFQSKGRLKNKAVRTSFLKYLNSFKGNMEWDVDAIVQDEGVYFNFGHIDFDSTQLDVTDLKNPIINASGQLLLRENDIVIKNITGKTKRDYEGFDKLIQDVKGLFGLEESEGNLILSGKIDLESFTKPGIHLNLQGENIYLNYYPLKFDAVVDVDSLIINIADETSIKGEATLQYGNIEVSNTLTEKMDYLYSSGGGAESKSKLSDITIGLKIPGNFIIHSEGINLINGFNIELSGELTLYINKNFGLVGKLEVENGNVYYIKNFEIKTGQLFFLSPNKLDTQVDIVAERIEKGKYRFQFISQGEVNKLDNQIVVRDISTDQIIPMSDKDKLALLTIGAEKGSFAADSLSAGSNTLLLEATGVALEGLARKWNIADRIDFRTNIYSPTGTNYNYFVYGKYLSNKIYVEYQGRLSELDVSGAAVPLPNFSWQAGNQIGIKYRINRNWSLNTILMKTFENNNKYRFDIRWKKEF
jgi:hypothetical protein